MNEVGKVEEKLKKVQKHRAELSEQKAKVEAERDKIDLDRKEALKRARPEDADKISSSFKKKLGELEARAERLELLLGEAENEASKAMEDLKAAESERERKCQDFVNEAMERDSEALLNSVSRLIDEAGDHLISAQVAWGRAAIIESALRQRRCPDAERIFQDLAGFDKIVADKYQATGFVHLDSFPPVVVKAGVIPPKDFGERRRVTQAHGESLNAETVGRLREEFGRRKNGL